MRIFTPLRAGVSLVALMSAHGAAADVTATEVWNNWKENISIYGENGVTIGSEDISGGTVTVSGLAMNMSEGSSTVSADMGDLVFSENGDGTVSITMADSFPITIVENGVTAEILISQTGAEMTASGTADAVNYQISADQYSIMLSSIEDDEGPQELGEIRLTMNGLNGNYTIASNEMRDISYALATDSIDMFLDVTEPGGSDKVLISGKMVGFAASALIALPLDADFENPESLLGKGASIEGGYGLESTDLIFDMDVEGDQVSGSGSVGRSEMSLLFSETRVGYNEAYNDLSMELVSAELPFPVTIGLGQYGLNVNFPVSAADAPEPFAFGLNLTDLSVNDEIWMMGDPGGQLSHDPLTFQLDLTGQGRWFYDLFDPTQSEALNNADIPGEVTELTLNNLTLRALGAALTGNGGFTFDFADMSTIPGVPRPEGAATFTVDGANKLIDTMIAMGLIPEEEAMMPRMMMGMFARTTGDDQLTSTIEVNAQGHVIANGQRIQ